MADRDRALAPPDSPKALEYARQNPGAWLYEIDPFVDADADIPPYGIVGAWRTNPEHSEPNTAGVTTGPRPDHNPWPPDGVRPRESYGNGEGFGGRYVLPEVIRDNVDSTWNSKNRRTFEELKPEFNRWRAYDNSVDGRHPILTGSSDSKEKTARGAVQPPG